MDLSWPDLLIALAVCHLAGDYLLQTDWQARCKAGGLGRSPAARRALGAHVASYTLAFAPVIVWLAIEQGPLKGLAALGAVAVPHAVVDDGRVVRWWLRRVKGVRGRDADALVPAVDQSMHAVSLWAVAVLLAV